MASHNPGSHPSQLDTYSENDSSVSKKKDFVRCVGYALDPETGLEKEPKRRCRNKAITGDGFCKAHCSSSRESAKSGKELRLVRDPFLDTRPSGNVTTGPEFYRIHTGKSATQRKVRF